MKTQKIKITALLTIMISFLFFNQLFASNGRDIDTVHILKGYTINILESGSSNMSQWGEPIYIIVEGMLRFPVSGVYLNLPAGSSVLVKRGGVITADDISRSDANGILIGGVMVWQKSTKPLDELTELKVEDKDDNLALLNKTRDLDDFDKDITTVSKKDPNNPNNPNNPKTNPASGLTYLKLYSLDELKDALK